MSDHLADAPHLGDGHRGAVCLASFPADVVGVIASCLTHIELRTSFISVCKRWYEIGMVVAKGTHLLITRLRLCFFPR